MPRRSPIETVATLEPIDPATCKELIGGAEIGRLGVVDDDGRVLILPVNFVVEGGDVVFRTAPGAALDHLDGPVTFEVDGVDPGHRSGWSVLLHGTVSIEPEPCDHDAAPEPWAGGHRRHRVRIHAERVTGRRIHPADRPWDPSGYL